MENSTRDHIVKKATAKLKVSPGTDLTNATAGAAKDNVHIEHNTEPLEIRVMRMVREFNRQYPDVRPPMTKEEIDAMWGQ